MLKMFMWLLLVGALGTLVIYGCFNQYWSKCYKEVSQGPQKMMLIADEYGLLVSTPILEPKGGFNTIRVENSSPDGQKPKPIRIASISTCQGTNYLICYYAMNGWDKGTCHNYQILYPWKQRALSPVIEIKDNELLIAGWRRDYTPLWFCLVGFLVLVFVGVPIAIHRAENGQPWFSEY